jgi:two-component system invasion response regulator UvrY
MIKVLLVDDHDLIRSAIKKLLQDFPGIKVVGDVRSGEEAIKLCKELSPAVVLMDLNMPGIGGLEATRKILRHNPLIRILILTVYVDEPYPSRLLHLGVAGYITKYCSPDEMLRAIKSVYAGEHYISQDIAQKVALSKYSHQNPGKILDVLSKREIQIMLMIIQGKQSTTIANELFLSNKTINTYRYRIFKKLAIQTDVELTLLGMRLGLLETKNIASVKDK